MNNGGYGGGFGGGNMQQIMKQAQRMQAEMQKAQAQLAESEVVGTAGGMVEITMKGDKTVSKITIKPEAVDPNDVEMLEDLIVAAFNEASNNVDDLQKELMGPLAGGMGGLF